MMRDLKVILFLKKDIKLLEIISLLGYVGKHKR